MLVHFPSIGNHNLQSWTKSGQTCNLDNVLTWLGFINLKRGSSRSAGLDKLWTDLVPRQTLDKVWISWLCHQPTQSSNIQSMTKSGQMLNLDNVWTNLGFITSKSPLTVHSWPTCSPIMTHSRPTHGPLTAHSWPTHGPLTAH